MTTPLSRQVHGYTIERGRQIPGKFDHMPTRSRSLVVEALEPGESVNLGKLSNNEADSMKVRVTQIKRRKKKSYTVRNSPDGFIVFCIGLLR